MNYSFMSFSCPTLSLQDTLSLAESLGYDGFEPRVDCQHAHGIELRMPQSARAETNAMLRNSPVRLSCLATSVKLAVKSKLEENMEDARRAIELCEDLKIPIIRIFGGSLDEDDTREDAQKRMAEALDRLSEEIGSADIMLCMETHDSWCNPADAVGIMKLCTGNHAAVNWDVMHTWFSAKYTEQQSAELLGPYIRHVHIHGGKRYPKREFTYIEEGEIDHRAVLRELHTIGYQGYLSGEWIGWGDTDDMRRELQTMRRYETELFGNQ